MKFFWPQSRGRSPPPPPVDLPLAPTTRQWKEFDDICIRFNRVAECDAQMDRFAVTISCSASTGMLTSDKNDKYYMEMIEKLSIY